MSVGAKAGKDFLLKKGDGAPTEVFTTIGGLKASSLKINAEEIDVTNTGSGQWKQLLDGAGIVNMAISGSGVFTNDTQIQALITDMLAQNVKNYEIIDAAGNKFVGPYKIKSLELQGEFNKSQNYQLSLQSAGAIVYTAGP